MAGLGLVLFSPAGRQAAACQSRNLFPVGWGIIPIRPEGFLSGFNLIDAVRPGHPSSRFPVSALLIRVFLLRHNASAFCVCSRPLFFRACLKIPRGAAAKDFGCGQGGEGGASPQRAVMTEPTPPTAKRPAARRVFEQKAVWLRCSSIEDP